MKTSRMTTLFVLLILAAAAYAERGSVEGRVTSMSRERDRYRITLADSGYTFWVPRDVVREDDIRVDRRVRLSGYVNHGNMQVESVTVLSDNHGYERREERRDDRWRKGVVESINRRLNYITIRDDESGRYIKVDVRHMDRERPVRVWDIRRGDRIRVRGNWEDRDTFDAERIMY
jgi:hypothetical protein